MTESQPAIAQPELQQRLLVVAWKWLTTGTWLHIATLMALTWSAFGDTLGGCFLIDDYYELRYASRIANGEWDLASRLFLRGSFWGPIFQVYRPLNTLSFVVNLFQFRLNPWGYHLTNLAFYAGDVLLCYLITRVLTRNWTPVRSGTASLLAGALFAVSPLHCESVCWISGRTDLMSAFFSLLALYFMLQSCTRCRLLNQCLAALSLSIALLVKEMAAIMPAVVMAAYWLSLPEPGSADSRPPAEPWRWARAFLFSLPLWLVLAAYLWLRVRALGTPFGGYFSSLVQFMGGPSVFGIRGIETPVKLLLPFGDCAFASPNPLAWILGGCYLCLLLAAGFRLLQGGICWRLPLLLLLWMAVSLIPLNLLMALKPSLEYSRLYFFFSVPFSIFFPALAFQPARWYRPTPSAGRASNRLATSSLVAVVVMICIFETAARAQNQVWNDATREARILNERCQSLAASIPSGKKLLVLGLPMDHCGIHLMYNSESFRIMLKPPFSETALSDKLVSMQPTVYGPAEFINPTRLKAFLALPDVIGCVAWAGPDQGFAPLALKSDADSPEVLEISPQSAQLVRPHATTDKALRVNGKCLEMVNVSNDNRLRITGLSVPPLDKDFLEFKIKRTGALGEAEIGVRWIGSAESSQKDCAWPPLALSGESARTCLRDSAENRASIILPAGSGKEFERFRVRLAHYWRWYASGNITALELELPQSHGLEICDLRLVRDRHLMPSMGVIPAITIDCGRFVMPATPLAVFGSPLNVPGATGVRIEVSKPDGVFDCFPAASQNQVVRSGIILPLPACTITLNPYKFRERFWYQVRARAIGKNGEGMGEYSDPLELYRWDPDEEN